MYLEIIPSLAMGLLVRQSSDVFGFVWEA